MKKYQIRGNPPKDVDNSLNSYSEFLRKLLFNRGITSQNEAEKFFNPDYESGLHDPFLLKNMDKAVDRILKAIKNNEKIIIFSDYDADGIPGAVVLHDFFKKIKYENFENYIPHRHDEGFGLNEEAIKEFKDEGAKLLITVDCGIADFDEVEKANEYKIDVIITDHHLPPEKIPKAFAIIDPKQNGCEYPNKNICGAGVAFKLVQALIKKGEFEISEGWEKWLLDMVGMATISDMVPLIGENRVFAIYGLKVLRKSPRIGLEKLLEKIKIEKKEIQEDDIGFSISPRINAASRMGIPEDAFKLLKTTDKKEAETLAEHLDHINNQRKGIVASLVKEVNKKIEARSLETLKEVIVLGNPSWKPSLLGLVANSLVGSYNRPVFLWGREGGELIKGSCRSNGSLSVYEIMKNVREGVLLDFGGHGVSGGFSVNQDNIHILEDELIIAARKTKKIEKDEDLFIDEKLLPDEVNKENYKWIEKLSPFGMGNPKPIFLFENIEVSSVKNFGKSNDHLELQFIKNNGRVLKAISFFSAEKNFNVDKLKPKTKINLVATIEKSNFRGYEEFRLRIVDIV
ncbi:MAG: single-stranded-DNA-specific exonuclease RecJ [Chitinophagaceae bacterium]|nr:single-stranded-DNA-specific exonuclease RecJ [Chitinophagaceae bacterium]